MGVIALISTIAVFIIRAGMVTRASRELGDVAADALGAARRARFRRKATRSPLTQLEDPREAVVAMMVAIAKSEGDITQAQMAVMSKIATERLEFEDADEIIAHARWLTQDATDPGIVAQRIARFLTVSCSAEQKADILDILRQVASVGREPSPLQLQAIQTLRIRFDGR
ncbi:MAG: TerB family tellurite resistance protein [Alphaproteobacteria bacterium]|nr:MAG: TerB family tellurite resistance protein [Alphaproteobacteria bacterium]